MTAKSWTQLVILSLLWGGSFFFVQVAVPYLPPLTIVLVRVGLGAAVLWVLLQALGKPLPKGTAVWRALFVMGLINNVIPFTLFVIAQGQITSGLAAILNATTPLFSALVAHATTRDERLGLRKLAGIVTGFLGVALMMGADLSQGTLPAQIACLGAALSYGLASVWGRRFRSMGVAPLPGALGQIMASSLILLPLVAVVDQPWTLPLPPVPALWALLGLATLSTALAYGLYFSLIANAGAVNASLVTFLIPVSAVTLGAVFLAEAVTASQAMGMALIALGLAMLDGRLLAWMTARPTP